MSEPCTVVILTFNSASIIADTIAQARKVSDDVLVVDSFSADDTVAVARRAGCTLEQRAFENYAAQRNWAIERASRGRGWQLHLDADEVLDDDAVVAIRAVLAAGPRAPFDAYLLRRVDYFLGRRLRFSGLNPWHLRLFRRGAGRCEQRLYDQHFVTDGPTARLAGSVHDRNAGTLADWTARHNRWSDLEAAELLADRAPREGTLRPHLLGDPRERARSLKGWYYRMPTGARAIGYFLYRYFVRLGFLDGREGFYFAVLQALWFRTLVDAKLHEARRTRSGKGTMPRRVHEEFTRPRQDSSPSSGRSRAPAVEKRTP
jgi:glycosyltransferase involved in cell wall biosynthesis